MAYITKEYLEDNIKAYDQYRKLDKEGQANGLATLDANGKVPTSQLPSGIGVTYGGDPVTSIVQGTNTSMSLSNGALTISATGGGGGGGVTYNGNEVSSISAGTGINMTLTNGELSISNKNSYNGDNISVSFVQTSVGNFCSSATITFPTSFAFVECTYYPMNDAGTAFEGNPVIKPLRAPLQGNATLTLTADMKVISKTDFSFIFVRAYNNESPNVTTYTNICLQFRYHNNQYSCRVNF